MKILAFFQNVFERLLSSLWGFLGYADNNRSLPPPLSAEEEQRCMDKLCEGDNSVREALIERNLRLVVYIARKFESSGVGIDDLVSIGTIGLIKAVNTFEPDKRIKLATYASRCIENEILMYLRRYVRVKTELSLDEPLNTDWDGNELLLSDILGTEGDTVYQNMEDAADKTLLYEALAQLDSREQLIMHMRFGLMGQKKRTQKEVADSMGISQSYISRLEKRIISSLRHSLMKVAL